VKLAMVAFVSSVVSIVGTWTVLRVLWTPLPVRAFRANQREFQDYVDSIREEIRVNHSSSQRKVPPYFRDLGVTRIRVESGCVLFYFPTIAIDSIEEVGCLVDARADVGAIVSHAKDKRVYTFNVLDFHDNWFFWKYDYDH